MRLLKFLSLSVAMSRNQAGFFIKKGRVSVDDEVITDPHFEVHDTHAVTFDKKPITIASHQYVVLYKPASYLCATKDNDYPSALNLINTISTDSYYYFANMLGPESTGLVILSNDVRWTRRIKSKVYKAEKIYHLRLSQKITHDQVQRYKEKVATLSGDNTLPITHLDHVDQNSLVLTTVQGDCHDIKQSFADAGHPIETICLQQIGKLGLGELTEGDCLELNADHIRI